MPNVLSNVYYILCKLSSLSARNRGRNLPERRSTFKYLTFFFKFPTRGLWSGALNSVFIGSNFFMCSKFKRLERGRELMRVGSQGLLAGTFKALHLKDKRFTNVSKMIPFDQYTVLGSIEYRTANKDRMPVDSHQLSSSFVTLTARFLSSYTIFKLIVKFDCLPFRCERKFYHSSCKMFSR